SSPIDVLTVGDELRKSKDLEAAGGDSYIATLSGEVATSAHAEHYARIVQERAALRELITTTSMVNNEAYEAGDVAELLDRAMQRLFEIASGQQRGGFKPLQPVLNILLEHLDKLHLRTDDSVTGVATGFRQLDEITSGFQHGDLIVIAARPSMGKTSFSLDLARYASLEKRIPVAYFSLEMASIAIAMRIIAAEARLDLHKLRSGKLTRDRDWEKLSRSTSRLSEMPFFIDDTGALTIMDLRARARMLKQQQGIGIVFIDYMQLMQPPAAGSREQEVAKISRALKGLARELDIPVVAMSQLSRAVEQRGEDARPQLSDLRDSGAIEQDADLVMFIHRNLIKRDKADTDDDELESEDNSAEIIIRKQRNGPTGTIRLTFLKQYATFEEPATDQDRELAASRSLPPSNDRDEDDTPF
ncbi:MAG TPA: replicative DNA helicase, partial [Bacteroidetes bacterium]|nr:replicative DNA helicase [Bacteroidota bacterium]